MGFCNVEIENAYELDLSDEQRIPFEKNYFDVILCNHVLEHVDNDILALKEIKKVLKKNGFGIVTVPKLDVID